MIDCDGCLEKLRENDRLKDRIRQLEQLLYRQRRKAKEGFFGSSTPSAQIPVKPNTPETLEPKMGGARRGHRGHGRKSVEAAEADRIVEVGLGEACPNCGGALENRGVRERTVIDIPPVEPRKILYRLHRKSCSCCGKTFQAQPPGVLPNSLYGNQLLAYVASSHYLLGIPMGRIMSQLGISGGAILEAMHRLGLRFANVPNRLIQEYRRSPVKHADETGWRNDGRNGWAWVFCTLIICIFLFRKSRSADAVRDIFGTRRLPGVLVVDRYKAYNRVPCRLQYCYAHLLRAVKDLAKEFPDDAEVTAFVGVLSPLLSKAMQLRSKPLSRRRFLKQAAKIKRQILRVIDHPATHLGIRHIQDIFQRHADRLYLWAKDRHIPAENNLAERQLRPTVIARKVSFGSQSDHGAKTREILMTVLHTLKLRFPDPSSRFKSVLDQLALNPSARPFHLLFSPNSS